MKEAIQLLEKKKLEHQLISEAYEEDEMYLDAVFELEKADAISYAISILKDGNKNES